MNIGSKDKILLNNEPKGLMPNFPKKQGKAFGLNLGQNVSSVSNGNFYKGGTL
jgi:hypothetical protein